ncbi:MAG: hypothetical protein JW951_06320 [Lentisphaerae bacterium]|nr:hypothetical protein [Lentisphaerota bacterium]
MKTAADLERLRAAEHKAQEIVARGRQEADRLRKDAEARVAGIGAAAESDAEAARARIEEETRAACASIAEQARQDAEAVCRDVAARLDAKRDEAVACVMSALRGDV